MAEYKFQARMGIPETTAELHARIKELTAIKDELDAELALLMGQKPQFESGTPWHCLRCDHQWLSRLPYRPKLCPQCKTQKFSVPPKFTYEERLARHKPLKAKLMEQSVKSRMKYDEARERMAQMEAPLPHSVITREVPQAKFATPQMDREEDISAITLVPPPVPTSPMTLREKLALMNKATNETELIQAINGEPDAT